MPRVSSSPNPIIRAIFPLLLIFVGSIYSGILEKTPLLGSLHILTAVGGCALIVVALGGNLPAVVNHPIGRYLAVFTGWFIICSVLGIWIGGSVKLFLDYWAKAFLTFVFVAGCVLTIKQSKTVYKTVGYSVGFLACMALALRGVDRSGRLGLLNTRYDNSNDLAWTLVLGLSFLLFFIFRGNRSEKVFAAFFSVVILGALVKTGSRAGTLGFLMLAFSAWYQSSRSTRIKLAIAVPVLLTMLYIITPPELRGRYTTIFGSGKDYTGIDRRYLSKDELLQASAGQSAENRWMLLKDSIHVTLAHPMIGVGPGNFQVAQEPLALARGESRGAWRVTHNSYTQISSEMGIPGLIIYLMFLYQCFKSLSSIVRSRYAGKEWEDLRALAKSLRATFVMLMTVAFFGSWGYDSNMLTMAGLACALSLIAQRQRALSRVPSQVTTTSASSPEPALEPAWASWA